MSGMSSVTIAELGWRERETRGDFARVLRVGSSSPIYFFNLMEFDFGEMVDSLIACCFQDRAITDG